MMLMPLLAAVFLFSAAGFAAAHSGPLIASAVYMEGNPVVIPMIDKTPKPIVIGTEFEEGDVIRTGGGVLEIRFDEGWLVRVDKDTSISVRNLKRKKDGTTLTRFHLFTGRVLNSVAKLATPSSKFEYQTRAAIAGVGGTPPFIVEYIHGQMRVGLLGKIGEPGELYVQAFDPAKSKVKLVSGMRTLIDDGKAPKKPFPIAQERFEQIMKELPFQSQTQKK